MQVQRTVTRAKNLLALKYLETSPDERWNGIPSLRELAERCAKPDSGFAYLDVCQFLKHALGLRRQSGPGGRLLYLFYDVPGSAANQHITEIQEFARIASADGLSFSAVTYQDVLLRLAERRDEHREWVDYMVERYL